MTTDELIVELKRHPGVMVVVPGYELNLCEATGVSLLRVEAYDATNSWWSGEWKVVEGGPVDAVYVFGRHQPA